MGIVGLGAIGIEVAKIAVPFGFRVSAVRRRVDRPGSDGDVQIEAIWPPDRFWSFSHTATSWFSRRPTRLRRSG